MIYHVQNNYPSPTISFFLVHKQENYIRTLCCWDKGGEVHFYSDFATPVLFHFHVPHHSSWGLHRCLIAIPTLPSLCVRRQSLAATLWWAYADRVLTKALGEIPMVTLTSPRKTMWPELSTPPLLSGKVFWPFRGRTLEGWKQRCYSNRCYCCCCLREVVHGGRCYPLNAGLVKTEYSRGRR